MTATHRLLGRLVVLYGTRCPVERGKCRVATWYMAALNRRRDARSVRVCRLGLWFDLQLHDYVDQWIYLTGFYERDDYRLLIQALRPAAVVFDVGAHLGFYTLGLARRIGPTGVVHAFEPNPASFERLRRHVVANGLTNVVLNRCALGRERHRRTLQAPQRANSAGATLSRAEFPSSWEVSEVTVDVRPLDEYCEEAAVDRLDLVKIDCEGWEPFVLQGAREALRRFRPRLQVEFNPRHLAGVGWGRKTSWSCCAAWVTGCIGRLDGALSRSRPCSTWAGR